MELKEQEEIFKEYKDRLDKIKGIRTDENADGMYVVDDIYKLDNGQLELEMINLPNKEYYCRVLILNVSMDLSKVKQSHQQLVDETIKSIYENKDLKNQNVRDLESRFLLRDSNLNIAYQAQIEVLESTIYLLKVQSDYYAGICNNLKKIYSVRNDRLNNDPKVNK